MGVQLVKLLTQSLEPPGGGHDRRVSLELVRGLLPAKVHIHKGFLWGLVGRALDIGLAARTEARVIFREEESVIRLKLIPHAILPFLEGGRPRKQPLGLSLPHFSKIQRPEVWVVGQVDQTCNGVKHEIRWVLIFRKLEANLCE